MFDNDNDDVNDGFINVVSFGRDESFSYCRLVFFIIVSIFANDTSELFLWVHL